MLMKNVFPIVCLMALFIGCQTGEEETFEYEPIPVEYPKTMRDSSVKDDYHGTVVYDPYRWLEDDNSEETKEWVKAQNEITFGYLEQIPFRDDFKQRLEKMWNYERYGTPFKEGGNYYYFKNDGLQNQSVLYVQPTLDAEAKVVLDPNKFSEDGTSSLGNYSFSENGKYLAYQISEGGSDWRKVRVKDLESGALLQDSLDWIKFSGLSWKDYGFYYSRYPSPEGDEALSGKNENHSLYYHRLGTTQSEDRLVMNDPGNPQRNFYGETTEDERFLVISIVESTSGNALSAKDLDNPDSKMVDIVTGFDYDFQLVGNLGDELLLHTNYNSPNWRLIAVNINQPEEENWRDVIPESEDVLSSVSVLNNRLVAQYMHDVADQLRVMDLEGNPIGDVELPTLGTIGAIRGKRNEAEAFYAFTSYTYPTTIYQLDLDSLESTVFKAPEVDFDADEYETKQEFYESKDGTKIPIFITHKKGLKKDGNNPTLLYGYGGFNIPVQPAFSIARLPLLEQGGVYAVANIRGGGEYGADWHKAGTLENKQNVFDDFIAAAEYLISQKITSREKLAIEGGSNGGLLVGACMTQRPDLFQVAFPRVGVLDMLRYHEFTIGWAWATDYGRSDNPEAFEYLYKYSPLHNIVPDEYPATLVTTADHDDRVVPAHSFKFISELQFNQEGENPVLIRIETSAGHGAGKPTTKRIEEAADMLSFMFYNTNARVDFENNETQNTEN